MANYEFDLLIVGCGPAGCTLALHMAAKGYRIGMIEKEKFPRHKICGDALSGKVLNVMKRIPGNAWADFIRQTDKIPSLGIRFTAPNSHSVDVPFSTISEALQHPPGYVCKRSDFDQFMFERLRNHSNIRLFEGEAIEQVLTLEDHVLARTPNHELRGQVIAGADGVQSVVRRSLVKGPNAAKKHICIGIRGYYEQVSGLHPENYIELIFLKRLLPGYFWIFPSTGGLANVGFGMLQDRISGQRENLIHVMNEIIASDPLIAPRFTHAKLAGRQEAHALPLASHRMDRSGNRFLLLGDAAFLVDPFSGEGIGNAMASGEIAAEILGQKFPGNDFSATSLRAYDERLNKRFSREFRTMTIMQRLAGSPGLFNFVVDKARKNSDIRDLLSAMFTNGDKMAKLTRPGFYLQLLFK
ncbi:MAG: NAD(P)/FAD-dependent oxidoreductase [Bacteroidales bacterium]